MRQNDKFLKPGTPKGEPAMGQMSWKDKQRKLASIMATRKKNMKPFEWKKGS